MTTINAIKPPTPIPDCPNNQGTFILIYTSGKPPAVLPPGILWPWPEGNAGATELLSYALTADLLFIGVTVYDSVWSGFFNNSLLLMLVDDPQAALASIRATLNQLKLLPRFSIHWLCNDEWEFRCHHQAGGDDTQTFTLNQMTLKMLELDKTFQPSWEYYKYFCEHGNRMAEELAKATAGMTPEESIAYALRAITDKIRDDLKSLNQTLTPPPAGPPATDENAS